MNLGHHVFAIHDHGRPLRRAQSHVQNGSVFRQVDLVAAEHGVDSGSKTGLVRQLQQQLEALVGKAIL